MQLAPGVRDDGERWRQSSCAARRHCGHSGILVTLNPSSPGGSLVLLDTVPGGQSLRLLLSCSRSKGGQARDRDETSEERRPSARSGRPRGPFPTGTANRVTEPPCEEPCGS